MARVSELRELITFHNDRYFGDDDPEISDADFDELVRELRALEAEHPELAASRSVLDVPGAPVATTFAPVTHRLAMTSLDNAMDIDELRAWGDRVTKGLAGQAARFVCELKIDGLALSIRFENGELVQAATRGDGKVGEDVTANVRTISGVPARLNKSSASPTAAVLEVRGEVYMSKPAFERFRQEKLAENQVRVAAGKKTSACASQPAQCRGRKLAAKRRRCDRHPRVVDVGLSTGRSTRRACVHFAP